jgi:predicted O-methyltransferase YrrM
MLGHRFQTNPEWRDPTGVNTQWLGLSSLITEVCYHYLDNKDLPSVSSLRMIEIGSYMGESTQMFATSNIFSEIKCIDPFHGDEEFNSIMNYTWEQVKSQFHINTNRFNSVKLYEGMSYDLVDKFEDNKFDFIYIDGEHTYEAVKRDIQLYLPKLRKGGIIAGHDYSVGSDDLPWPGVNRAVNEELGKPDRTFWDTSWMKIV